MMMFSAHICWVTFAVIILLRRASSLVQQSNNYKINNAAVSRRMFFAANVASTVPFTFLRPKDAFADIPMITTDEFSVILRDSAQAVKIVEFGGPKGEAVIVRLKDGLAFGLKDVVESPVDPRSPLKIAAMCRENRVPTKFLAVEAALQSAPKKTVLYTNERVRAAAEKEKEKQARIRADEQAQLNELYKRQEEEAVEVVF